MDDRTSPRVLVVGGLSRAAQAFRGYAATMQNFRITTLVRRLTTALESESILQVPDYFALPNEVISATDVVINFVGITHGRVGQIMHDINTHGPVRLASVARKSGVSHFVHLSSFHVYGYAETISLATPVSPQTPYARSKLAADEAILKLATKDFAVTVLRLPILYGVGVGQNLSQLATLMAKLPAFPVSARKPRRSAMHVNNLAVVLDALVRNRAEGVLFGSDAEPFTLDLLADVIGEKTGRHPRLIHLPEIFFLPLKILSRGLHSKLYENNIVLRENCFAADRSLPVSVRAGLRDIVTF